MRERETRHKSRRNDDGDAAFVAQMEPFVDYLSTRFPALVRRYSTSEPESAVPLMPVIVDDVTALSQAEREMIRDQYCERGVIFLVGKHSSSDDTHPLSAITTQLVDTLDLSYPIAHPKETDALVGLDVIAGGVKVYDHREAGVTYGTSNNEDFGLHQDGLGSTGAVRTVALHLDSPPLAGGYNCFQNFGRVALNLARRDSAAFKKLFLPDAITITRPSGPRAISVTGPVFYLDDEGHARINFVGVAPSGRSNDYHVRWITDSDARRGLAFLLRYADLFASGTRFCHMNRPGSCVFFDNRLILHGRTAFFDAPESRVRRMVSRKWFASRADLTNYRHAPGLRLLPHLASIREDLFGVELLEGEWLYKANEGRNVRLR